MRKLPDGQLSVARKLLGAGVLVGSVLASYTLVSVWQLQRPAGAAVASLPDTLAEGSRNPFETANGTHLLAFVFAASDCGWSTRPATMEAIGSLREKFALIHGSSYAQVTVVGVILDRDLNAGLRYASELGNGDPRTVFDQIVLGGSWLNEEVVRHVWRGGMTEAATPQVLVVERPVDTSAYGVTSAITVEGDHVIVNPSGSAEIVQWVSLGLPLDYMPYRQPSNE